MLRSWIRSILITAFAATMIPCVSQAKGLVGHWSFDQDNNLTKIVYDQAGAADGILRNGKSPGNGPVFVPGKVGHGCRFSRKGYNVYLDKPKAFSKLGNGDFTFTGWLKQGSVQDEAKAPVILHNSSVTSGITGVLVKHHSKSVNGKLAFTIKNNTGKTKWLYSDKPLGDNKWHWFALRVLNGKVGMWVDGIKQKRKMSYVPSSNASAGLHCNTVFGGQSTNLCIDDFRLYDEALNSKQLLKIYSIRNVKSEETNVTFPNREIEFYVVKPFSRFPRLPDSPPREGKISGTLDIIAAPGEYEPGSIVIYTRKNLADVFLKVADLKGPNGSIAAENIDIRTVKCWYQAGTAWKSIEPEPSTRVLVPELLLKDDSLVRVDYKKKINYVKLSYPQGESYIDMSQVKPKKQPGMKNSEFPVRDSNTLLPLNIPGNTYKQIWITAHIPQNTKAGLYKGTIEVSAKGKPIKSLALNIRVLPFKLSDPRTCYDLTQPFVSSIYYKGILMRNRKGTLKGWFKTDQQFYADLKNMVEHGVTNPLVFQLQANENPEDFDRLLNMRKELGMINDPIFLLGKEQNLAFGNTTDPERLKQAQQSFLKIKKALEKHGIKQIYTYGMDESKGKRLASQKPIWNALHQVGDKIFVSGYMHTKPTAFDIVGQALDLLIMGGGFVGGSPQFKEVASKWHSTGKKVWSYGNPQGGVENPDVYRRNYGLFLWLANFDGAATYIYHHGYGHSWNDFDGRFRDHNLTYPTINGVVDTVAWEGYREAIDDIRYATTLKLLINKMLRSSDPVKQKKAKQANDWLESVNVLNRDLDTIRLEIIQHILQLKDKQ